MFAFDISKNTKRNLKMQGSRCVEKLTKHADCEANVWSGIGEINQSSNESIVYRSIQKM